MLSISDCFRSYQYGNPLRGGNAKLGGIRCRPTNNV